MKILTLKLSFHLAADGDERKLNVILLDILFLFASSFSFSMHLLITVNFVEARKNIAHHVKDKQLA